MNKRMYQPIWEKVRDSEKHRCEVTAHPAFFNRVIKAVIKEKDQDLGFKVLNDHDNFRLHILRDKKGQKIVFTLVATLGLEGVKN